MSVILPLVDVIPPLLSSCHVTFELVTTESLGTLQEREMEVGVMETTLTLGWPGTLVTGDNEIIVYTRSRYSLTTYSDGSPQ